jgi:hypothetical protein
MQISPAKNHTAYFLSEPFSENDVLYLQKIFLTPGVHEINVDNVVRVRNMMDKVLDSLQYHHKAACVSLQNMPLADNVTDIVKVLLTDDYLVSMDSLTLFFLDHFYFDFLWIEESPDLLGCLWYEQFKQHLTDFNFNKSISIVKVKIA